MRSALQILSFAGIATATALQKPLGKGIQYLGRVPPTSQELTWPGTGVAFAFTGTSVTIGVTSITGNNSANLYIDDQEPIEIPTVVGDIVVPTLPYGSHNIALRKRSETVLGNFALSNILADGPIDIGKSKLMRPSRQIEVIGDSITVGYGADGVFPCPNTAAVEDNPQSYGVKAANLLDADYSIVAWSGRGLIRNYLTDPVEPLMPELWTRYGANDPDNSYTFPAYWNPQVVTIALGTNDWGYIGYNASGQPYDVRPPINVTEFSNAMVTFVHTVHKQYRNATFFLIGSPLLSDSATDPEHTQLNDALERAVGILGNSHIQSHFVNWPSQTAPWGCDYHPSDLTQATEGYALAGVIQSVMGW